MSFDTDFADSAWPVLLGQFGETVIYRPESGAPRTLTAIVTRAQPGQMEGMPRGAVATMTVEVENNAVRGIAMSEVSRNRDKIDVADVAGGALVSRLVGEVHRGRSATVVLEVG